MIYFSRIPKIFIIIIFCLFGTISKSETDYGQVAITVANLLENLHYSKKSIDDNISSKLLERFLYYLDYNRIFFTAKEIDSLKMKYNDKLDDYLFMGNLNPAIDIYNKLLEILEVRIKWIESELEKQECSFDSDENVFLSRKKLPWPKNEKERDHLWKNHLEGEVLLENLRAELRLKKKREKEAEEKKTKEKTEGKKKTTKTDENEITEDNLCEKSKEKVLERWNRVLKKMKDNNEPEEICNIYLSSLASVYDPHSDYFSQSEWDNFMINMENSLIGIGAMLSIEDGYPTIQGLVKGGPAQLSAKISLKDKIARVANGEEGEMVDVKDMDLQKVVELIRGKLNTIVRLEIIPAEDMTELKEVIIIRKKIKLKDKLAYGDFIKINYPKEKRERRYGWIYVPSFYADKTFGSDISTSKNVKAILERMKLEGIEGLVLDLRGNGGGFLDEAIKLTGLFIPEGPVVFARDSFDNVTPSWSKKKRALYGGPLVVLVDRVSASASEIVSAALQDYERAIIVGEKATFGKGTVQTVTQVNKEMPIWSDKSRAGALKITIQKFYRIAGGSTQLRGVIPDIILPSRRDPLDIGEVSMNYPLEYDEIDPEHPYEKFGLNVYINKLKRNSKSRISKDMEFQHIIDDLKNIQEKIDKNVISLNKKKRLAEREKEKKLEKQRKKEKLIALKKIKEDKNLPLSQFYKFTIDNVRKKGLVKKKRNGDLNETEGMIMAKDDDDIEEESLEKYPHYIPPVKKEVLNILEDLIMFQSSPKKTARVETLK